MWLFFHAGTGTQVADCIGFSTAALETQIVRAKFDAITLKIQIHARFPQTLSLVTVHFCIVIFSYVVSLFVSLQLLVDVEVGYHSEQWLFCRCLCITLISMAVLSK